MIDKQGNDLDQDKVFMVAESMFNAWVCAPKSMTKEQVQAGVNLLPAAGTSAGWQVQEQTHDDPRQCSPGECAEDDKRQHWLVLC